MYCIHCEGHYYPEITHLKYPSKMDYKKVYGIEDDLKVHEITGDYIPYARERAELECPHCKKRNIESWNFQFDVPKVYEVVVLCSKCNEESRIDFRFNIMPI